MIRYLPSDHKILAATGAFAGYAAVMAVLESRMRATGVGLQVEAGCLR